MVSIGQAEPVAQSSIHGPAVIFMTTSTSVADQLFSNLPFWVFVILAWVTWRLLGAFMGIVS